MLKQMVLIHATSAKGEGEKKVRFESIAKKNLSNDEYFNIIF